MKAVTWHGRRDVRIDDILPLVLVDGNPLGAEDFHSHQLPLEDAPRGYEIFQKKEDNAFKILLKP